MTLTAADLASLVAAAGTEPDRLAVASDAAEELGQDALAARLRDDAAFWRMPERQRWLWALEAACRREGGIYEWEGPADNPKWEATVNWSKKTYAALRVDWRDDGPPHPWHCAWWDRQHGWTDSRDRSCDPPACALAVLAALRRELTKE